MTAVKERVSTTVDLGHGVTAKIMSVDHVLAEEWLRKNVENNRNVSISRVRLYGQDMATGRWRLSDQAISFDTDDHLINGRHRLTACTIVKKPFLTLVLWGLPPESMLTIDSGKRRTTDDAFKIAGLDHPRGCGGTVRRMIQGFEMHSKVFVTDSRIDEFMQEYGKSVAFAHKHLPGGKTGKASIRAVVAKAHAVGKDEEKLAEFCKVLRTDESYIPAQKAALALNNYVTSLKVSSGAVLRKEVYRMTVTAVHHFLNEDKVDKLRAARRDFYRLPDEDDWVLDQTSPEDRVERDDGDDE